MLKTSGLAAAALKPSVIAIGLASNEPPRFVAAMGEGCGGATGHVWVLIGVGGGLIV